jgi:hypothetical protein
VSEGKFQSRVIEALSGQGLLVQKFNDLFSPGIPDFLVELPTPNISAAIGLFPGMWLEAKFVDELPKRMSSPWPKKVHPSAEQMGWMRRWDMGSKPCAMLISTPFGWACVPFPCIPAFLSRPHPETRALFSQNRPAYGEINRNYALCKSRLT